MLGILGGAAVVAVGVGVGGVAMLNKGEESAAVVASGSCGTDVQWSLDEKGVLRLSGTGRMTDYQNATEVPWEEMRNQITRVQFDDAITNIGNCAFYACSNLTEVITPKALSEVGKYSFAICTSLVSIDLPNGTKRIGEHAFTMDSALKSITIPSSVLGIGTEAFYNCERLTKVKINKNCSRGNDAFPRNVGISYY